MVGVDAPRQPRKGQRHQQQFYSTVVNESSDQRRTTVLQGGGQCENRGKNTLTV